MKILGNSNGQVYANSQGKVLLTPYSTPATWQGMIDQLNLGVLDVTTPVGSQINDTWGAYTVPWDVVHHVKSLSGNKVMLNWHYAIPDVIAFDAPEALYYTPTELAAGTYYITIKVAYGTGWVVDQSIQFTLTQALPAGGQIYVECSTSSANNPTAGRTLKTYATKGSNTVLETTTTSNGTSGTRLGETATSTGKTNGNVNAIQRIVYGYGRWSQSAIRQYLNSTQLKNSWWTAQNNWDRPTAQVSTLDGFLSKCSADFLAVLTTVPVVTALNTVEGFTDTYETTYDKIFLPSLQEMYITPQLAGVEGKEWDYYKTLAQQAGLSGKFAQSGTYAILKKYILGNTTSSCYVWLRSASRGGASLAWYVYSSGTVNAYGTAYSAYRGCPACILQSNN